MSLLTHLSIRHKLLIAFGSIALLTAVVGFMAVTINSEIATDISQIREAAVEKAEAVSAMAESLLELKLYTEESLIGQQATTALGTPNSSKTAQGIADTIHEFEEALALTRKDAFLAIELAKHEGNAGEVQKAKDEVLLLGEIDSKY